jgi:trimethyllysine dioxygenase
MSMTAKQSSGQQSQSAFIKNIVPTQDGLEVRFSDDDTPLMFSWFWLRDHGVDEASLDPDTLQRRVDTFSIPADLAPLDVRISAGFEQIEIDWRDFPSTTLTDTVFASATRRTLASREMASSKPKILWDKDAPLSATPSISYDAIMADDNGLLDWLEQINVYGFSVIEGVPATEEATKAMAQRVGRVQETIFGRMWMLSAELQDHGDTAYSTQYLEPHTDSSYYHDAPGLQLFNCLEFDGKGGESVQVDGFALAEKIRREDPDAYATLTEVVVPAHYLEPGVHLRAERPAFRLNSAGELLQMTFNNYDRAPFYLSKNDLERFHHAYGLFHKHVLDQNNWMKIPLRPGRALIFDNWRNLHGRMGYVGKRVFYGCYISRAELESTLRVLQTKG